MELSSFLLAAAIVGWACFLFAHMRTCYWYDMHKFACDRDCRASGLIDGYLQALKQARDERADAYAARDEALVRLEAAEKELANPPFVTNENPLLRSAFDQNVQVEMHGIPLTGMKYERKPWGEQWGEWPSKKIELPPLCQSIEEIQTAEQLVSALLVGQPVLVPRTTADEAAIRMYEPKFQMRKEDVLDDEYPNPSK